MEKNLKGGRPMRQHVNTSEMHLRSGDCIVCEGDSATNRRSGPARDTWPYLRLMNWHQCWPEFLGEVLFCGWPHLNVQVRNAAVSGSTCHDVAGRLQDVVLPLKPDWVLMTLGGNDVHHGIEPAEFQAVLAEYATRLHAEHGTRTVFLGAYCDAPHAPSKMTWERIGGHYEAFDELAAEHDYVHSLILWDVLSRQAGALAEQWEHHTMFSGPDAHWNAVGHRLIAMEVLRAFGLMAPDPPNG
jgi:lysophospholipase L1-like esterase